jgi:[acyl-carrier-protein] S-malonyltransferase
MKKLGFIFAGQGSQKDGMCKDFFENSTIAKELVQKASQESKIDFEKLMFEKDENLGQTEFTQPAILLTSMVAFELFKKECNTQAQISLGHSLGEFSALASVGAIDTIDAVKLVNQRGLLMKQDCEGGKAGMMVVLGLSDDKAEEIVATAQKDGKKVWCANYNVDGQIVMAGLKEDLEPMTAVFKESGAKRAMLLDMSVASHCPILQNAANSLTPLLESSIKDSFSNPIISNVTADKYSKKDEAIKLLTQQLTSPVKYKQSIAKFANEVDMFIEFGNGAVLKGLNKKITDKPTLNVSDMKTLEETLKQIN